MPRSSSSSSWITDSSSDSSQNPLDYYDSLPSSLRNQLSTLHPIFKTDKAVLEAYNEMFNSAPRGQRRDYRVKKALFRLAMLNVLQSDFFLESKWFPHVYAYETNSQSIVRLTKTIYRDLKHNHVFVAKGLLDDSRPVVVKWYKSGRNNTLYEIGIYEKLQKLGCPLPWFASNYRFWENPVLVMEHLEPLKKDDNPFDVGKSSLESIELLTSIRSS